MLTIGLIVDGQYDLKAISALLRKVRSKRKVKARQCGGGRNISKAIDILKIFERERNIDLAIWVTDAENDDPREVEKLMNEAVKKAQPLNLTVKCVVAVRMLEAWLLADEAAIKEAGGKTAKFTRPEGLQNPKAELRRLFDRPYTDALAEQLQRLARKLSPIDALVSRNSSRRSLSTNLSLSPRGDWRAPSDGDAAVWLAALDLVPDRE